MELSLTQLGVTLDGRRVLDGIDAVLWSGRVTAILGPNGAGKSTLLKAIAALLTPSDGMVSIGDRAVATLDPRERARLIGYLPQDARVHWDLRVRDVVALGRVAHRSPFAGPSDADRAAIDAAMAMTETAAFADRGIATLSGGERARVLLARVLAGDPAWLLADEPMASLDPAHQLDLLDQLRGVAARGRGVAVVLHDLLHAGRIADDVVLLQHGRVVAHGSTAEVLTADTLARVFDIAVRVSHDSDGRPMCVPIGRVGSSLP
ncbi:ABC transporter ATP-binding protein [Sphingomonas sp. MMS24-J45]|uniref:ABC transporter ATP-binding protein n=1 Tax=Sphingomonas sp. MMS24-J45 TaxID=3238806 RepID=UPI00384B87BA